MESSRAQNDARTDYRGDSWVHVSNGRGAKADGALEQCKSTVDTRGTIGDGGSDMMLESVVEAASGLARLDELPDEIQHWTEGQWPLSLLLTRLAQRSHNKLSDMLLFLASKQAAQAAQAPQGMINGHTDQRGAVAEDTVPESLEKKKIVAEQIQIMHTEWVKALVLTEWSKKAKLVGRLIDLRVHLASQIDTGYFDNLRKLDSYRREWKAQMMPSPDLKTALEVLSTGEAPWMPSMGYIPPPRLTGEEMYSWLENLNTLLSVRLSLKDHDTIPDSFRDYSVGNGRATFRVKGEFEVDLTIADEDFEKQFWFIDFRLLFSPCPAEIPERMRQAFEVKVNAVLATDGLTGCYQYLHEFVLTLKIQEFKRQAYELSQGRWVDTLELEQLNRAISVQYWTDKSHSRATKSWIILGVHSGNDDVTQPGSSGTTTSRLFMRWFRDNKEVRDVDLSFDVQVISAEKVLSGIIARHVEFYLESIHSKLMGKPRFANKHANLALKIVKDDALNTMLAVQLLDREFATLSVQATSGAFSLTPPNPVVLGYETRLNAMQNPVEEGPVVLERMRWAFTSTELGIRSRSTGWTTCQSPMTTDDMRSVQELGGCREGYQAVWMQRRGWEEQWYAMLMMGFGGDQWWLIEVGPPSGTNASRLRSCTKMPSSSGALSFSDAFFDRLTVYATGLIGHMTDLRALHAERLVYQIKESKDIGSTCQVQIPVIYVRLADLLRTNAGSRRVRWADEYVPITYRGVANACDQDAGQDPAQGSAPTGAPRLMILAEARLALTDRSKFKLLKGHVDDDVSFDARSSQFCLRLRAEVGTTVMTTLTDRITALVRLINFVEAMHRAGPSVQAESVTLRQVVFRYSGKQTVMAGSEQEQLQEQQRPQQAWKVRLDLAKKGGRVGVLLEKGNPHLRVIDMLEEHANSAQLEVLPQWLALTLPLMRGMDWLEEEWDKVIKEGKASIFLIPRDLFWIKLRFTVFSPQRRDLELVVRPRVRHRQLSWQVTRLRQDEGPYSREEDYKPLQDVFSRPDEPYVAHHTSAVASSGPAFARLLQAVSNAVMTALLSGRAPMPQQGVAAQQSRFTQAVSLQQPRPPPNQGQGNRAGAGHKASAPLVILE